MSRASGAALVVWMTGCVGPGNTADPPGDLAKFDPVASFEAIAKFAGPQARVMTLRATGVKSDGTMDLGAGARVEAEFVAAAIEGDPKAQPEAGFAVGHAIRVKVSVERPFVRHVVEDGSEWDERHLGMERSPNGRSTGDEKQLESPVCGFATLWQKALEQRAPGDELATIDYDAGGYTLAVGRSKWRFTSDCTLGVTRKK